MSVLTWNPHEASALWSDYTNNWDTDDDPVQHRVPTAGDSANLNGYAVNLDADVVCDSITDTMGGATLTAVGAVRSFADFSISPGTALTFSQSATLANSVGYSQVTTGNIDINGSISGATVNVTVNGSITVPSGGSLTFPSGRIVVTGTLAADGSSILFGSGLGGNVIVHYSGGLSITTGGYVSILSPVSGENYFNFLDGWSYITDYSGYIAAGAYVTVVVNASGNLVNQLRFSLGGGTIEDHVGVYVDSTSMAGYLKLMKTGITTGVSSVAVVIGDGVIPLATQVLEGIPVNDTAGTRVDCPVAKAKREASNYYGANGTELNGTLQRALAVGFGNR